MKQFLPIMLFFISQMLFEKTWAQDTDNIKPSEPSGSMIESIINNVSEIGVNIKNVFISPPDPVMELKKQGLYVIRSLEKYALDVIDLRKREKSAPDSSWFGDTKDSVREDLNEILEDLQNILLGDKYDYIEQISNQDEHIKELKKEVAELQEKEMVALEEGNLFRDGKDEIQEKIKSKLDDIKSYENNIEEIYTSVQERFKLLGIELSKETIETLMRRIDGNDVMQNVEVVNTVKQLIPVLTELMETSKENKKKYYGVSVILREVIVFSQEQYLQKNRKIYLPKFDDMFIKVNRILENAKKNLSNEDDANRKKIYEINIEQNSLTINIINLHREVLGNQFSKVEDAMKNSMKDLLLAHNIYETAEASLAAMDLIKNSEKEFNAIMEMQVPEIVPFENEEMREKFYDMTKDVRALL